MQNEETHREISSVAGSEGSGANQNNPNYPGSRAAAAVPASNNAQSASDIRPDDTSGATDISQSGLPKGGTLPDEETVSFGEKKTDACQRFLFALDRLESAGEMNHMLELFASTARATRNGHWEDKSTIQDFWQSYREQFDSIKSEFTEVNQTKELAVLEWESKGRMTGSNLPINHRGVSIIKFLQDKIVSFATYFDSSHFVRSEAA